MKRKLVGLRRLLQCLMLLAALMPAEAAPVQVYAIALDYRLSEDGTKHYNRLLKAFSERGLDFKVLVRSLKRSQISLKGDVESCLFPATINAMVTNDKALENVSLIASDSIDQVSLRVLTDSSKERITGIDQLAGKRIAILNGLNPDLLLGDIDADVEPTPDEYVRLKMLNAGRLDAVLGFTPDILLAAEDLGLPVPHYSEDLALFKDEGASMVCHDTELNRAFVSQFNRILKDLKASGDLQRILGKYAVIAQ